MRLNQIHINPLAGVSNRTTVFQQGLNVVLGPNEAGKSTLVKALELVLFKQATKLSEAKFREFLPLLPVSGGDHIHISLAFSKQEEHYQLERHFAVANGYSRLVLPGGAGVQTEDAINQTLQNLTGINQAAFNQLFIIQQSKLTSDLTSLNSTTEIIQGLSNLLRNNVMNMGGVSADSIREAIMQKMRELDGNFDTDKWVPKGNRDIDNPYTKGNGKIIDVYYNGRYAARDRELVLKHEIALEKLTSELGALEQQLKEAEQFVHTHKQRVEEVRLREQLGFKITQLDEALTTLKQVAQEWPSLNSSIQVKQTQQAEWNQALQTLQTELTHAKHRETLEREADIYNRALPIQLQIQQTPQIAIADNNLTTPVVKEARQLEAQLNELAIQLNSQQLNLSLQAQAPKQVNLERAGGETEKILLQGGDSANYQVSGKAVLQVDGLTIEVSSGNMDVSQILIQQTTLKEKLQHLLMQAQVESVGALEIKTEQTLEQQRKWKELTIQLKAILNSSTFEQVQAASEQLKQLPKTRAYETVMAEVQQLNTRLALVDSELKQELNKQQQWLNRYESLANLDELRMQQMSELKPLQDQLNQLAQLPDGFESATHFIAAFEQSRNKVEQLRTQTHQIVLEQQRLVSELPDKTSEELSVAREYYGNQFRKLREEYLAYAKILNALDAQLNQLNHQTFQPLIEKTSRYFQLLTNQSYTHIELEGALPKQVANKKHKLGIALLSKGTKDSLALAVRLAMCEFYLHDQSGFMVMDDPLTDMDPLRRSAAIELIQHLAQKHQIIYLTCHPEHAVLLGGHRIDL